MWGGGSKKMEKKEHLKRVVLNVIILKKNMFKKIDEKS